MALCCQAEGVKSAVGPVSSQRAAQRAGTFRLVPPGHHITFSLNVCPDTFVNLMARGSTCTSAIAVLLLFYKQK